MGQIDKSERAQSFDEFIKFREILILNKNFSLNIKFPISIHHYPFPLCL